MTTSEWNARVIEQFRAGGEIEGMHRERLVLLTTTGRSSGERRTAPMMFLPDDGDAILVVASADAAPDDPDWFLNLVADPHVHVEAPDGEYDATAEPLDGEDRERAWAHVLALAPFFADHQDSVDRTIPVIRLTRSGR
ncbi:MAG: nitroreductase/quinone reductase family protein [Leifsonia sp.]